MEKSLWEEVTPSDRLSNAFQVLHDRLGIIKVTGLNDDHRVNVKVEHASDQLTSLDGLGSPWKPWLTPHPTTLRGEALSQCAWEPLVESAGVPGLHGQLSLLHR